MGFCAHERAAPRKFTKLEKPLMRAYACHAVEEVERSHKAAFIQPPAEREAAY